MRERKIKNKIRGAYFTTTISLSLVLLLIGIIGLLLLNARSLSQHVRENLCFSLIMKDGLKVPDIKQFQKILDTRDYIRSTEYITSDSAAAIMQEELGEDFVSTLGYNPLSSTINVYLKSSYANPDSLQMLETLFLSNTDFVDEVAYQRNLLHLINDNIRKISISLLVFSVALFLISFTLLNNTIRLMIYSKRFIIRTMRLVGARNRFIRKPFLVGGIMQGLVGALIAIAVLVSAMFALQARLPDVQLFTHYADPKMLLLLGLMIIVVGIVLTYISTLFSINKYMKIKSSNLYY